jgi:hypothetical protein
LIIKSSAKVLPQAQQVNPFSTYVNSGESTLSAELHFTLSERTHKTANSRNLKEEGQGRGITMVARGTLVLFISFGCNECLLILAV